MRFWRRASGIPKKLAVLASAFHPPTRAHLALARAAIDSQYADQVLFVVPGVLPHKHYDNVGLQQRLELVLAATADDPRFSTAVSEGGLFLEIARECRPCYPSSPGIAFLCGRDAAERIVAWDYGAGPSIEEQLREFSLLVAPRGGAYIPPVTLRHAIRELPLSPEFEEVSATEVRDRIARGEPWRHLVPESIAETIEALYAR